jgi:hypothetical protein
MLDVFEWCAWDAFLITHVWPDATRISVVPGTSLPEPGDRAGAAMVHVNLSQPGRAFPGFSNWLARHEAIGRPVINGYFDSIDKWAVQDACRRAGLPVTRAAQDGDPDEMLIIKARANHYGRFERYLASDMVGDMAPPPWPYPERVHRLSRAEIPVEIWSDPRITVERYIGNSEDRFMRAYVTGDFVAVAISQAAGLVKEMDQKRPIEMLSTQSGSTQAYHPRDPLAVAHRLARTMRVDFGALDLAVDDDGVVYPIDINTTPAWGTERNLNPGLLSDINQALTALAQTGSRYCAAAA